MVKNKKEGLRQEIPKKGGIYPALFLSSIFAVSIFQIKSYDLWWHIKAGEFVAGAGLKPAPANIFSWTEPAHPWINFSWLFDVIVYLIHKAAGFNGLIVFQAVLVAAVFLFVYKTALTPPPLLGKGGGGGRYGIFVLLLIAYFTARFRFSLRPHLLALLFFSVDIYILNLYRATGKNRLYLIPLIQTVWANIHGSAILGISLPVLFPMPRILFFTVLASFLNPHGYKVFTDPFVSFFGQGADQFSILTVDEWQMPDRDMFLGWYGLLLAAGAASFLLPSLSLRERVRVRVGSPDLLLFSIFALLSIKAVRFIDLFAVAAIPVIYKNVVGFKPLTPPIPLFKKEEGQGELLSNSHFTSQVLPFALLILFWIVSIKDTTFKPGLGVDEEVIPEKAVDFMERNDIEGKIFNSYNSGGYLIYKGHPVFIDGRLCYSPEFTKEFADANMTYDGWRRVEEKYHPDIALIEYAKPVIPEALLQNRKDWALVYWDDLSMLFLKRTGAFSDIIEKNEYRYLNPMDMYGRSLLRQAQDERRGMEQEEIFAEAQRRVKDGPESMRAHLLLGNLRLGRGEADRAVSEYRAVIESPVAFGKAEAHNNLGTAYERMGNLYGAEMEYREAIRLDRAYPLPHRNLGYLELGQLRHIEALWHLDRYLYLEEGDRDALTAVYSLKRYRDIFMLRVFIGGMAVSGIMWVVARRFRF